MNSSLHAFWGATKWKSAFAWDTITLTSNPSYKQSSLDAWLFVSIIVEAELGSMYIAQQRWRVAKQRTQHGVFETDTKVCCCHLTCRTTPTCEYFPEGSHT